MVVLGIGHRRICHGVVSSQTLGIGLTMAGTSSPNMLPADLQLQDQEQRDAIRARLADFAAVPPEAYFYELCYCLCTPQSKAVHAFAVVERLRDVHFMELGWDPTPLLRDPATYIRFHTTKGARLLAARQAWPEIARALATPMPPEEIRDWLVTAVNGFGMKEASHFLRNIGRRGLAIIDRHLLTNLIACGVYTSLPSLHSPKRYRIIERRFRTFSSRVGIDMDELDLLFWSNQAGLILK